MPYTIDSTTPHPISYSTIDPDLIELIIEQNNTIIKQNIELLKHLQSSNRVVNPPSL